jgi:hypothetical protein
MECWFSGNQGGQQNTFMHVQGIIATNVNNLATTGMNAMAHRCVTSVQKNTITQVPISVTLTTAMLGVTTRLHSMPIAWEGRSLIPANVRFSKQLATMLS